MTNEVTRNIITRRSCKKFKSDSVSREMIDAVVEAGLYAANGMGKQSPIINEKSPMRNSLWLLQHYWYYHSKNRQIRNQYLQIYLRHYLSLSPICYNFQNGCYKSRYYYWCSNAEYGTIRKDRFWCKERTINKMWEYLFQEHILGRGLDYFIHNLVGNVYVKDNIIEATVYGTKEYKVEIMKNNEEIVDLSCNCPYADSGNNCKYMAAVLFYLEEQRKCSGKTRHGRKYL